MTELEISTTLGLISDPCCNKFNSKHRKATENMHRVIKVFNTTKEQKKETRDLTFENWTNLIPWYSFN